MNKTMITHLGERVGFKPEADDEKHIKTIGNDLGIGISEVVKRGLKLYYDLYTLNLLNETRRKIDDVKTHENERLKEELSKRDEEIKRLKEEMTSYERRAE